MKIAELKQVCSRHDVGEGKRGIEKQSFQLPGFIAATGIEKIRQAYIEKVDNKKLKKKQSERMQPKMWKMGIDYHVLHDAFFKYQTKPKLTSHGDLYFDGKEFERYGPPPSYPHLKMPGLNSPIPLGATFGYPGGWGKPPVDEHGRPLYGDVFGVQAQDQPNYEVPAGRVT